MLTRAVEGVKRATSIGPWFGLFDRYRLALKGSPQPYVVAKMRIRLSVGLGVAVVIAVAAIGRPAAATAGTHPLSVSTFDTRASSIAFGYKHGFSGAGSFNTFSYNANFTSTTGRLSAQFGIHYVNFKEEGSVARAHGVAGSGVGVLVFPVAGRYENGVPKVALALSLGGVPTAYVSGERNFLTLPFVMGFGVPMSPVKFLTFTPWYELAASVNVDTIVRPEGVTISDADVVVNQQTGMVSLREGAVEDALAKGLTIDVGVSAPMRVGLEASAHLGKSVDFNVYAAFSTLGGAFSGDSVKTFGGALVVRWDDIVPAVLPQADVVPHETCDATERRFRACPISRQWLSPEQRGQTVSPTATPEKDPRLPTSEALPASPAPAPVTATPAPPAAETPPAPAPTAVPAPTPGAGSFPTP